MSLQPRYRAGGGGKSKPKNAARGRGGEINQEQVQHSEPEPESERENAPDVLGSRNGFIENTVNQWGRGLGSLFGVTPNQSSMAYLVKIKVLCDEREFCYKVSAVHTTVLHIKKLVLDSSFDGFSLKWEGKTLKDTDSLAQSGIVEDVTLSLQPRVRGGGGGQFKPKNTAGEEGDELEQQQDDNTTLLSSGSQVRAGMSAAMHGIVGADEREVAAALTHDGGRLDTGASADERLRHELGNATGFPRSSRSNSRDFLHVHLETRPSNRRWRRQCSTRKSERSGHLKAPSSKTKMLCSR